MGEIDKTARQILKTRANQERELVDTKASVDGMWVWADNYIAELEAENKKLENFLEVNTQGVYEECQKKISGLEEENKELLKGLDEVLTKDALLVEAALAVHIYWDGHAGFVPEALRENLKAALEPSE